ncbi:MAG: hypothetical protein HY870_23020 [Chloroflexi bacterium]|nr:hypothetical protein [Chloroflexota bacterium]
MFARKIVPILLVAGAVHMIMKHGHHGWEEPPTGQAAEGHAHGPQFGHGPFGHRGPFGQRGDWANRVPPIFEMLHNRAHAAQTAAQTAPQQPSAPAAPTI